MDTPEKTTPEEDTEEYIPVEEVSYSFLFFLMSGALLVVTLWSFWDDEYARRGYKQYQEQYYKEEFAKAKEEWKSVNDEIITKELEIRESLEKEGEKLDGSSEFRQLADETLEAKIHLDETVEQKKFAGSRLDEAYYYFKKAQHEGENFAVQKATWENTQKEIDAFDPVIKKLQAKYDELEGRLLEKKAQSMTLEKELQKLTNKRDGLVRTMDFYKPFPFFWKPTEILQAVIPGARLNKFKEITYKVDRCMTCHIAYDKPGYEHHAEPLKTHPGQEILIGKHPPGKTGCTWCHKGQGAATAPAEDAHGSHHEMDQSAGINEPIVHEQFMESMCMNCHSEVIHLEGADELSHGRELFLELGCHGCHLADGFQDAQKVGPGLLRIASKVNPTWLYKWVKNPKGYLPKTRMPNFGFDNKDALAVTAYLMASSEKGYQVAQKFKGGDAENGKKLFETVGCQACHSVNGKGEEFAPDLSNIANKVNANWLVSWIDNPAHYNSKSKMPNLRIGLESASDITAYLIKFGKPRHIKGIEQRIRAKEFIAYGETVVRRRGCFACHEIKGMEKEGRIAPELSSFGGKQTWELEFGDTHIPHTWKSWAATKLKKPDSFRTERVLDKMPNFGLNDKEIHSLLVLLKGWSGLNIPEKYKRHLSPKAKALETGRRIVNRYNCKGCHVVEGAGGIIQKYIRAKNMYPPPLEKGDYHVGERIKSSWIFSFLKHPTPVRTWLKVKMPTFNFTEEEAMALTAYFEALVPGKKDHNYESDQNVEKPMESINTGVKMANYMDCGNCHDDGEKGIDFSIASSRLRHEWIPKWLKNTRDLIPETKMPSHWPKKGDKYVISSKFSDLEQVEDGNVDRQVDRLKDYIVSYNTADINFDLAFGEEGGDDEGEDDEDGDDEDEEGGDDEGEDDEDEE